MLPRNICQYVPPPTLVLKISVHKGQEMKPGDNAAQGNILEIIHKKKQTPKGAMPSKRENQKRPPYAKKQKT